MASDNVMVVKFDPAMLPERMEASAAVEQGAARAAYVSRWRAAGTRYPLESWVVAGRAMLAGAGAMLDVTGAAALPDAATGAEGQGWLTDLDVAQSPTMAALRAHGENRVRDHRKLNILTTWFLHLRGHENEIWICAKYDIRRDDLAWEIVGAAGELRVEGIGVEVVLEGGGMLVRSQQQQQRQRQDAGGTPSAHAGETPATQELARQEYVMRLSAGEAAPVDVEVEIYPPENDRAYVDGSAPLTLRVRVTNCGGQALNGGAALIGGRAVLLGLDEEVSVALDLPAGESREIEIVADLKGRRGIIPLAARYEHARAVGLGFRTIWAPPVVLETDQPFLDGMYAENLRSMVHRFTFNTWREDEPRYPCYIGGVFARNLHSALAGFGFERTLWGWTRLWLMSLRSCGYMPEAFDLVIPPLGEQAWRDADYKIGNDGLGFVLIQWGKLFLRAGAELRREMLAADMGDLERASACMRRFLHWDGRIEDHSEPVEGIRTDKMFAGSPFAQSLCLAGALLVRRALDSCGAGILPACVEGVPPSSGERERISKLRETFASLAAQLRKGLDKACEEGYFSDVTSDQNQLNPHTYTNLAPGMVLGDPDLAEDRFDRPEVLRKTVEFNGAYHATGRPWRVMTCPYWPPHPGLSHNAYAQIAMVLNCLNLGSEGQAAEYLADLVIGARGDFRKHMISDPNYTVFDWTDRRDHEFSRYIVPEGAVIGHDSVKINPGNGVNCSYFLYLIDRMMGVTPRGGRIEICPQLAGQRRWRVRDYRTALGLVSYRLRRGDGGIGGHVSSPSPVTMLLPLDAGVKEVAVAVDGARVESRIVTQGDGRRVAFEMPAGKHEYRISETAN